MANKLMNEIVKMDAETQVTSKRYPVKTADKWSKDRHNRVFKAIHELMDVANGGTIRELALMMNEAITIEHRYLQSELVEAMLTTINIYADARYDGRNRTAVAMCRVVSNELEAEDLVIPKVTMEAKND